MPWGTPQRVKLHPLKLIEPCQFSTLAELEQQDRTPCRSCKQDQKSSVRRTGTYFQIADFKLLFESRDSSISNSSSPPENMWLYQQTLHTALPSVSKVCRVSQNARGECNCRVMVFWVPCCVKVSATVLCPGWLLVAPLELLVSATWQTVIGPFFPFLFVSAWKKFYYLCENLTYAETVGSGPWLTLLYLINPGNSFPQHRTRPRI